MMYILIAEVLELLEFVQFFEPVVELLFLSFPLHLHRKLLLILLLHHAVQLLLVEVLDEMLGDRDCSDIELGLISQRGGWVHRDGR